VINSLVLDKLAERLPFDKVVFNLPIVEFDARRPHHVDLADAAKEAEKIASVVPISEGEHFIRVRKRTREKLAASGIAERIDNLVATLLG
jgi:hypothetical protein